MATKIVTKNSSTASAVPTASDLVQGELAVNVADKRLFTEDNGGAIVELGTNPSTLTVTGEITANGGIALGDNDKATFGAGDDLQIYHDGSHSYVGDYGTGNLSVTGNNLYLQNTSGETYLSGISDGEVSLYHNNAIKLATTSTGIDVTGTATMGGVEVSDTDDIRIRLLNGATFKAGIQVASTAGDMIAGSAVDDLAIRAQTNMLFATGGNTERMRIDSSGNVGIGTSAPNLTGFGTGANGLEIADATLAGIRLNGDAADSMYFVSGSGRHWLYGKGAVPMTFSTNGSERMRIDTSGNLLVGTTSTSLYNDTSGGGINLFASGGVTFAKQASSASDPVLLLNNTGSDGQIIDFRKDGTTVGSIGTGSGLLTIGTGTGNLLFENALVAPCSTSALGASNGVVDLGASTRRFKDLYISGNAFADNFVGTNDTDTFIAMTGSNLMRFFNGGTERMRINSSGQLLVGCTSEASGTVAGLSVNNAGYINTSRSTTGTAGHHQFFNPNGFCGVITTTGTTTTYATSSDQRLKENIADADDAGSKIDAIQVRKFDWKADGEHQDYGMIAQELLTVEPRAVAQGETEEDIMAVDYSQLVPMLIKEIQSLRNRVAQLEE